MPEGDIVMHPSRRSKMSSNPVPFVLNESVLVLDCVSLPSFGSSNVACFSWKFFSCLRMSSIFRFALAFCISSLVNFLEK